MAADLRGDEKLPLEEAAPLDPRIARTGLGNHKNSDYSQSSLSSSESEDYDKLKFDLSAVVEGSKGGGLEQEQTTHTDGTQRPSPMDRLKAGEYGTSPDTGRRKSIQVRLEETSRKGRYVLTADDPDIREVLRRGLQREAIEAGREKQPRSAFRDMMFTRQFTTFDRQNPKGAQSPFHGFFTLFWLAMGGMLLRVAAQNWRNYGSVFGGAELLHMMFDRDVMVLGLTDGAMTLATMFGVGLQKLVVKGYLRWDRSGWIIQNIWQTLYLGAVIGWTFYREWPWTHTVFIVLHAIVFLMKQHSYAFYNGYLSQIYRRKLLLQQKLKQLDDLELVSPATSRRESIATGTTENGADAESLRRRRSSTSKTSTNFHKESSKIASIAQAIESGQPLDADQMAAFSRTIKAEIELLDNELKGKCTTTTTNYYPSNLTVPNWADWTCLPTLVYELEYPRQEKINWWYVAEKAVATFGVIWIMMVISQAYIYPCVASVMAMKERGLPLGERSREFPWVVADLLFPLLLEQLLSWYVIWECALNVLAELTRFADRGFYGDWWNSVSWDQYARDWNRPVHNFLLRHVYHSSISAFHLSRTQATFVTFLLSACVHELVMFCLFKKVRGYLFAMQLLQIPLAALSRTRLLRGRDLLGNLIFWLGLFVGPSVLFALYLIV